MLDGPGQELWLSRQGACQQPGSPGSGRGSPQLSLGGTGSQTAPRDHPGPPRRDPRAEERRCHPSTWHGQRVPARTYLARLALPCPPPPPETPPWPGQSPPGPPGPGRTAAAQIGAVISHLLACPAPQPGRPGRSFQVRDCIQRRRKIPISPPRLNCEVTQHPALPWHAQPRARPRRTHSPLRSWPSRGKAEELERLQVVAGGAVTRAGSAAGWEAGLVKKFGLIP